MAPHIAEPLALPSNAMPLVGRNKSHIAETLETPPVRSI